MTADAQAPRFANPFCVRMPSSCDLTSNEKCPRTAHCHPRLAWRVHASTMYLCALLETVAWDWTATALGSRVTPCAGLPCAPHCGSVHRGAEVVWSSRGSLGRALAGLVNVACLVSDKFAGDALARSLLPNGARLGGGFAKRSGGQTRGLEDTRAQLARFDRRHDPPPPLPHQSNLLSRPELAPSAQRCWEPTIPPGARS